MSACNHTPEPADNLPAVAALTGDAAADQPHADDDSGRPLVRLLFPRGVTGREVAAAVYALHRERHGKRPTDG